MADLTEAAVLFEPKQPLRLTPLYLPDLKPGQVLVVNTGSIYDEAVFRDPASLLKRPLAEGALYLENIRLQYIHALCLARPDGEHDQVIQFLKDYPTDKFMTSLEWPDGFVALCENILSVPRAAFTPEKAS